MRRIIELLISSLVRAQITLLAVCLLSATVLTACSIHPVQQDVTGIPTKLIVQRIRCEARLAVIDKAIDLLHETANELRETKPAVAEKFEFIVQGLHRQRGGRIEFDPRSLPTDTARAFYSRYVNTVIAYDFLMQGVENNRIALAADPVRLITNGSAGVLFGGSSDLTRDNQRHFAISDTFSDLLFKSPIECASDYRPENFLYPVSGQVGLRGLIDTFIDLNEDKPLSPLDTTAKTMFADTMKFTTILTGSVTPHVQIDPVGTQFGLAPANIGLSASRTDTHTLSIGLAMGPPQFVPATAFQLPFAPGSRPSNASRIQQSNRNAAFQAIDELRYRSFLDRVGTSIFR